MNAGEISNVLLSQMSGPSNFYDSILIFYMYLPHLADKKIYRSSLFDDSNHSLCVLMVDGQFSSIFLFRIFICELEDKLELTSIGIICVCVTCSFLQMAQEMELDVLAVQIP